MSTFDKKALSADEHIAKLRTRGLIIPDAPSAKNYLNNISYFRLSAYTRPFYVPHQTAHTFRKGTCFDDVLQLYIFDRELRLLLLDVIERLEVALRAQLANQLAKEYGPHGYLNPTTFDTRYQHAWLMQKLQADASAAKSETFLAHYNKKYTGAPKQPPIWMAVELLTFKEVSILFSNLRHTCDTQAIESHFGWKHAVLKSWFRSLSDLRNLCAHHARVWNREFGSNPVSPKRTPKDWPVVSEHLPAGSHHQPTQTINARQRVYMQLVVIQSLMQNVNRESDWVQKLVNLLNRHPGVSRPHMGFPVDWQQQAFWQSAGPAAPVTERQTSPPGDAS